MKAMKLLLKENVESLGLRGDIVTVKPGYGRNYLIPQGLAIESTPGNMKLLEQERRKIQAIRIKEKETAQALAAQIGKVNITIQQRAGEEDKLYGSVTNIDIANQLMEKGIEVDRKKILLEEPIKSLGSHEVSIKIHPEVTAKVNVVVEKEE